jgi:hypothetical protein
MGVLSIAATYALSVAIGIAMAGAGSDLALLRRDAIVEGARSSETLVADRSGDHVRAAFLDFTGNLRASVVDTVTGITVVGAYPIVAYRGWVGGIVSVDARHRSRLGDAGSATYYLVTLVLQLIPYSIAGGVGVRLGVGAWRAVRVPRADTWIGLPTDGLRDAALAFFVVVPLFLVASERPG